MTTILFHAQDHDDLERRLEDALALARASSGHLSCVHVTPAEAYVTFDAFGGVFVMDKVFESIMDTEARVRARCEAALKTEDVSWDYEQIGGPLALSLAGRAGLADLLMVSRRKASSSMAGHPLTVIGDLIRESRTPLFIPGDRGVVHDPLAPAVIGWNGSIEAANAVRSALPWLRLAERVTVVRVVEPQRVDDGSRRFPSTRLLEYLSRHGIHAELETFDEPNDMVAPLLMETVGAKGAGTLIMGGYGHSRFGEYWFGGVTRALLEACPVALIVAH
ncbi:universal stress protein [Sphingomonas jaspsi]|uniref:universal stress protein n=1 Tax=Sphingomonas jaspsi TaxID=392409 RepID=UPI0004B31BB8|nr:universal stress protein [Sphingomonas jaspsi]